MPIALLAVLVVPGLLATAMVVALVPAGDWLDDSPVLMLGVPAVASAVITFLISRRRGTGSSGRWSLASAVAAVVLFCVLFVVAVAIDCAARSTTSCT